jgi:hypothetical protein
LPCRLLAWNLCGVASEHTVPPAHAWSVWRHRPDPLPPI